MKSISMMFAFFCLILVSSYMLFIGIVSLNGTAINDQINQYLQTASYEAGTDMGFVIRRMFMTTFLARIALVLIGLMGLMIGIVGLYGIIKGKSLIQSLRAPGSIIGLILFFFSASAFWYIFGDLGRSVSIIIYLNSIAPGSFDQLQPWLFIFTIVTGLVLIVLSGVLQNKKSRLKPSSKNA